MPTLCDSEHRSGCVRWEAAPLYVGAPLGSAVTECTSHTLRKETHTGTATRFDVIPGGESRQRIHITAVADADMLPSVLQETVARVPHTAWAPLQWGLSSGDGVCGLLAIGYHFLSRH